MQFLVPRCPHRKPLLGFSPPFHGRLRSSLVTISPALGTSCGRKCVHKQGTTYVTRFVRAHETNNSLSGEQGLAAEEDELFMREALLEAKKAALIGEVPVGAVLVTQGKIISRAHNRVEAESDPTAHAEMVCIRNAARQLGCWRLLDSTLYVTLEPCAMCTGALLQARIRVLVWGARNTLLGADGSWVSLLPRPLAGASGGGDVESPIHPFNPGIEVRRGVLASECSEIMREFFRARRTKAATAKPSPSAWLLRSCFLIKGAALAHALAFVKWTKKLIMQSK